MLALKTLGAILFGIVSYRYGRSRCDCESLLRRVVYEQRDKKAYQAEAYRYYQHIQEFHSEQYANRPSAV